MNILFFHPNAILGKFQEPTGSASPNSLSANQQPPKSVDIQPTESDDVNHTENWPDENVDVQPFDIVDVQPTDNVNKTQSTDNVDA